MVTLREYIEEKECDEVFSEGFIMNTIGKLLGFGASAVLYAWIAALLIKGGSKAINSISRSFTGKDRIKFEKAVKEAKKSPAVQEQMIKQEEKKNKYEDELSEVLDAINKNNVEKAAEEFKKLDTSKQNSTEIKQLIIDACSKNFGYVISNTPTPGTPTFKAIRAILGLPEAKAAAAAFEQGIKKIMGEN